MTKHDKSAIMVYKIPRSAMNNAHQWGNIHVVITTSRGPNQSHSQYAKESNLSLEMYHVDLSIQNIVQKWNQTDSGRGWWLNSITMNDEILAKTIQRIFWWYDAMELLFIGTVTISGILVYLMSILT